MIDVLRGRPAGPSPAGRPSSRFQPHGGHAGALQGPRQGPRARPGTLPQAHRRAPRPRPVPQVRKRAPSSRPQPVPYLRGEEAQGRARPVRQGQGRRQALRRPGSQGPPKDRAGEKQKRMRAHRDAGLCTRCGCRSPVEGGATAGLAVTRGKRPNGSCMPPGGPRAGAAGVEDMPLKAPPAAVPALLSRPGVTQRRTRPAEGATPTGERGGVAPTAANPRRGRRGAYRARTGLGALGPTSGPSDPSAALHRDRDRHGRGPRDLGQLGGGGHVPGLRPAVPRSGRNN